MYKYYILYNNKLLSRNICSAVHSNMNRETDLQLMAKNKVRNNWRQIKGNWYYRLMVWNGSRQNEWTIPMKTKDKKWLTGNIWTI